MRHPVRLLAVLAVATLVGCTSDAVGAGESAAGPGSPRTSETGAPPTTSAPSETPSPSPPSTLPSTTPPTPPVPTPQPVARGDGRLTVVPGTGPVSGPGAVTPYVVEVEGGLGVDPAAFAAAVDRVLTDRRSWGAGGRRSLRRVDAAGGAVAFRVALASPATTDRLCAPLQTNGYFSCGNGDRAVLNLTRWLTGAPSYAGRLPQYREYLVNHEVGHTLGRGHEPCPAAGRPAPVMLQQTKGLDGCARNSWPYP